MTRSPSPRSSLLLLTAVVALVLSSCASNTPATGGDGPGAEEAAAHAALVTVTDSWVKAASADDGMTAAFGTVHNGGAEEAVMIAARAAEVSDVAELHEVVPGDDGNTVMRKKDGGLTLPAGSERELSPGADHIMLMGLTQDLEPGSEVTVTLEFGDGSTIDFTAPVKDFEGANEDYDGGH